jgi:hypothetical protein
VELASLYTLLDEVGAPGEAERATV